METGVPGRRRFLGQAALGGMAAFGDLGVLGQLPTVLAEEAAPKPGIVRLRPEIEPLVSLIETTPRDRIIEEIASRVVAGRLRYQQVLAALLLAGVRNVQPRPSVGFKFHAVLVVNSAHLASMAAPDGERWLPILWALDEFKRSQARDIDEGDWTMGAIDEARVPPPHRARAAFESAMDAWDVEAADAAVAGLARGLSSGEVFELFARYAARDFRSIGHKAIFVANAFRALQHIGWRHAEPVLRSLAYALLNHNGEPNPAENDLAPDRPWRENAPLAAGMPAHWTGGKDDSAATADLLAALRQGTPADAAGHTVALIEGGVSPQSVYDGLLVGSGELLMRQPGIVALHAMTTSNALRYLFNTVADDGTRRLLLLQNASFLALFRDALPGRGSVGEARVDELEGIPTEGGDAEALEEILADISGDRAAAAGKLHARLEAGLPPGHFIDAARRLIFAKGNNSHDYKFSSAVLEDFYEITPEWRNRYLAASVFNLRGTGHEDNALVQRSRRALGGE